MLAFDLPHFKIAFTVSLQLEPTFIAFLNTTEHRQPKLMFWESDEVLISYCSHKRCMSWNMTFQWKWYWITWENLYFTLISIQCPLSIQILHVCHVTQHCFTKKSVWLTMLVIWMIINSSLSWNVNLGCLCT